MMSTRRNLTDSDREEILQHFLTKYFNGVLPHDELSRIAKDYGVHRSAISRLGSRVQLQSWNKPGEAISLKSRTERSFWKKKNQSPDVRQKIKSITTKKCQTLRTMAAQSGLSFATIHRFWRGKIDYKAYRDMLIKNCLPAIKFEVRSWQFLQKAAFEERKNRARKASPFVSCLLL